MRSSAKSAGCIYPSYRQFQSIPCYVHRVEDKDPVLEKGLLSTFFFAQYNSQRWAALIFSGVRYTVFPFFFLVPMC